MKSDIFQLGNSSDINLIPQEIENVGKFCKLDDQDAARLRLLAEEMISLVETVSSDYAGEMWVENDKRMFNINMEIETEVDDESKKNLLGISGSNTATKGIKGKITSFLSYLIDPVAMVPINDAYLIHDYAGLNGSYQAAWTMSNYVSKLSEGKSREWDGLEKSIIVKLADDIEIGVRGRQIVMVVKKTF